MEVKCRSEDGQLEHALVARPTYLHGMREPPATWRGVPDAEEAHRQWRMLCDTLESNGVTLHVHEEATAPDGAYVRDVGKVIGNTAHVFSPGGHRRGDQSALLEFCNCHGVDFQQHPGTIREGADFLLIGGKLYVGISRRTKAPIFTGYPVACVERRGARPPRGPEHLMGGHRKLGNVVYRLEGTARLDHNFATVTVPLTSEEFSTRPLNWIALGQKCVLLPEEAEHVMAQTLRKSDVKVITTPCSELLKMGGGPACLTLPLVRR